MAGGAHRGRFGRAWTTPAFALVLDVLGLALAAASRGRVPRLRRQLTRDVRVEIGSDDGVARVFAVDARRRTLTLRRRPAEPPDVALRFPSGAAGLRALLSPHAVGRIVEGVHAGTTRIEGHAGLVLWFYGLTRVVAPIGRQRRPRTPVPYRTRAGDPARAGAGSIAVEPPVTALDPAWTPAWRRRAELWQVRAAGGEPLPPG